jgi:hypothetical protein
VCTFVWVVKLVAHSFLCCAHLYTHTTRCLCSVEPIDDNMFKWEVLLFNFDKDTQIKQVCILFSSLILSIFTHTYSIILVGMFVCMTFVASMQDLELYFTATGRDNVKLEVNFPFNYPHAPPFIRVVYPRFHQYTGETHMRVLYV